MDKKTDGYKYPPAISEDMETLLTIHETPYHSWCSGTLATGCAHCVKGRKLVLFVTGMCGQRCFYCPVSDHKFGKDNVYANEWKIEDPKDPKELIEEAKLTGAKGAGITGGDPLVKVDRTCAYIKLLKKTFGKSFHIHLYTPLLLVTKERLQKLFDSGLDEIRFHPDLDDEKHWNRLLLAEKYSWERGVEIPVIPGYEEKTKKLIDFIAGHVGFLNLNELELSDTTAPHYELHARGYQPKDSVSYGVNGSLELGQRLITYAATKNLKAHVCTAKLKDSIQVGNRLKLRAKHVALQTDTITSEGLLLRGVLYLPGLEPSLEYQKRLAAANRAQITAQLEELRVALMKSLRIKEMTLDPVKMRLLTSTKDVTKHASSLKKHNVLPAIVEEYPTCDGLEVEIEFL